MPLRRLDSDLLAPPSSSNHTASTPSSPSSSPTRASRRPPTGLRLDTLGVEPATLIGKHLVRINRSTFHPQLTLRFADKSGCRVRVDGYDPAMSKSSPILKTLESDSAILSGMMNPDAPPLEVDLTIEDCTTVSLTDKAFSSSRHSANGKGQKWNQDHVALAFKFEGHRGWHCLWAMLTEYDEVEDELFVGERCVFRSFDDVYVESIPEKGPTSPQTRKRRNNRRKSFVNGSVAT